MKLSIYVSKLMQNPKDKLDLEHKSYPKQNKNKTPLFKWNWPLIHNHNDNKKENSIFFFVYLALGDGIIKLTLIAKNQWPAFGKAS